MKRLILVLSFFLCLLPLIADEANNYIIEMEPDQITVHVSRMDIPDNTQLREILKLLPELIERGTEKLLSNYELTIDDVPVGSSSEVMLDQMQASEIDKIEIQNNPVVSNGNSGQGGSINIVPRQVNEGVSGKAQLSTSTLWNVAPSCFINYRKNYLTIYGTLMGSYERTQSQSASSDEFLSTPLHTTYRSDSLFNTYRQEMAKLGLIYEKDGDILKVWFWEYVSGDTKRTHSEIENQLLASYPDSSSSTFGFSRKKQSTRNIKSTLSLDYKHTFDYGGNIRLQASGNYLNDCDWPSYSLFGRYYAPTSTDTITEYSTVKQNGFRLNATLKTEQPLLPASSPHKLKLTVGLKSNYNSLNLTDDWTYHSFAEDTTASDGYISHTGQLSPFFKLDYKYGRWALLLSADYLYYRAKFSSSHNAIADTIASNYINHNFSFNADLFCQVADHHALRLCLSRRLMRPSELQLMPSYYWKNDGYYHGNEELHPATMHTIDLNYIFDYTNDKHSLVLTAGLQYNHADGLIASIKRIGSPSNYTTFINRDINDIFNANLGLYYNYESFSFCFAANLFNNTERQSDAASTHHFFYNISFTPICHLPHQWGLYAQLMYNSKIETSNSYQGDCFYAQLRVDKTIKHWNIYAALYDIFGYQTSDYSCTSTEITRNIYDLYHRNLRVGFSYTF